MSGVRFEAYCRAQGLPPDQVLARDGKQHGGAYMQGFIVWLDAQRKEFERKHRPSLPRSMEDEITFDEWLDLRWRDPVELPRWRKRVRLLG